MQKIAIVSNTSSVSLSQIVKITSEIQTQITRDFSPLWEIDAILEPFGKLDDVPQNEGHWKVIVTNNIPSKFSGTHFVENNLPTALVRPNNELSISLSHEILEMLVNPRLDNFQNAPSLDENHRLVDFRVEICDPCEDAVFAYTINNFKVSDFVTPAYYGRQSLTSDGRLSFKKNINNPFEILEKCSIDWVDALGRLIIATMKNGQLFFEEEDNSSIAAKSRFHLLNLSNSKFTPCHSDKVQIGKAKKLKKYIKENFSK